MEHRYTARITCRKEASLYARGELIATGRVRDVSLEGMYIDLHPPIKPLEGGLLVEVLYDDGNDPQHLVLPVLKIHQEENGIGVMFNTLSEQSMDLVRRFLHICQYPLD